MHIQPLCLEHVYLHENEFLQTNDKMNLEKRDYQGDGLEKGRGLGIHFSSPVCLLKERKVEGHLWILTVGYFKF